MSTAEETNPDVVRARAIAFASFHGFLWFAALAMMIWYVPRVEDFFTDFEFEPPAAAQWVIACSFFSRSYWFLLLPLIMLLGAVLLWSLSLHREVAVLRRLWSGIMLLLPLGVMAWTVLTLGVAIVSLAGAL